MCILEVAQDHKYGAHGEDQTHYSSLLTITPRQSAQIK